MRHYVLIQQSARNPKNFKTFVMRCKTYSRNSTKHRCAKKTCYCILNQISNTYSEPMLAGQTITSNQIQIYRIMLYDSKVLWRKHCIVGVLSSPTTVYVTFLRNVSTYLHLHSGHMYKRRTLRLV